MRTLVASPFEDDAAEILRWGYGEDAHQMFLSMKLTGVHRVGQAFMNVLSIFDPDEYQRLSDSLFDPFYQDKNLPAAIDLLTSK
jgi:hypothetical protein